MSRETKGLTTRVLTLPDASKFEIFQALLDDLGEQVGEDDPAARLVRERKEALEIIGLVAEHLGLAALEAPTVKQFDAAVSDCAPDWSSQKVIRVWERWRLATQAYKGERKADPLVRRRLRQENSRGLYKRSSSDYLSGVRRWLTTKPEKETGKAYDAFAEQFNAQRASIEGKEERKQFGNSLVQASAVTKNLRIDWSHVLKVAKEEIELAAAQAAYLAERLPPQGQNRIIGLAAISRLLKQSYMQVQELAAKDKNFPVPVAFIHGSVGPLGVSRAWLYEDVMLYKRGLAPPDREEGELQNLFVDAEELQARLAILPGAFRNAVRRQRWDLIPKPEGALVQGVYYWQRSKVNHWLKDLGKTWAMGASLRAGLGNTR